MLCTGHQHKTRGRTRVDHRSVSRVPSCYSYVRNSPRWNTFPSGLLSASSMSLPFPYFFVRSTGQPLCMPVPNPPLLIGVPCSTFRAGVSLPSSPIRFCSWQYSAAPTRVSTSRCTARAFLLRFFLDFLADQVNDEEGLPWTETQMPSCQYPFEPLGMLTTYNERDTLTACLSIGRRHVPS